MKTIDKILSWGIALLVLVPMASCSDDDDTDNGSDIQYRSIVGEWYSDFGMDVEGSMDWGISAVYSDGTTDGFLAHVSKEEGYLIPVEGNYKISGTCYVPVDKLASKGPFKFERTVQSIPSTIYTRHQSPHIGYL